MRRVPERRVLWVPAFAGTTPGLYRRFPIDVLFELSHPLKMFVPHLRIHKIHRFFIT